MQWCGCIVMSLVGVWARRLWEWFLFRLLTLLIKFLWGSPAVVLRGLQSSYNPQRNEVKGKKGKDGDRAKKCFFF